MKLMTLALLGLTSGSVPAQTPTEGAPSLRARVEALAGELEHFGTAALAYRRATGDAALRLPERLVALLDDAPSMEEIRPLLDHDDPRVRSLAVALVFDRDEWGDLLELRALLGDDEPGIPAFDDPFYASDRSGFSNRLEESFFDHESRERLVGDLARTLLDFHVEAAGAPVCDKFPNPAAATWPEPPLTRRWRDLRTWREGRQITSGIARVRLARLSQGLGVLDGEGRRRGVVLLESVLARPAAEAASILLALVEAQLYDLVDELALIGVQERLDALIDQLVRAIPDESLAALFTDPERARGMTDADTGPWLLQRYLLLTAPDTLGPERVDLVEAWTRRTVEQRTELGFAPLAPVEGTLALAALGPPEDRCARLERALDAWMELPLGDAWSDSDAVPPPFHDSETREPRYGLIVEWSSFIEDEADIARVVDYVLEDPHDEWSGHHPSGVLAWYRSGGAELLRSVTLAILDDDRFTELGARSTWELIQFADQFTERPLVEEAQAILAEVNPSTTVWFVEDETGEIRRRWHELLRETRSEWSE